MAARFLTDEHVRPELGRFLQDRGHVVERSRDLLGEGATDKRIAELAEETAAIVITWNKRDFDKLMGKGKSTFTRAGALYFAKVDYSAATARISGVIDVVDYEIEVAQRTGGRFFVLVGQVMVQVHR
jgi:hypothetical protein